MNNSETILNPFSTSYDRDEETESETKIRVPDDDYDNMESAGKSNPN